MARVTHRAASARAARTRVQRNRPYKVIQETVTQAKRKQLNVITFSKRPPPGFIFVPTGNPNLTQRCKQLSRLEESKVFTVSTSLGHRKNSISREVHRIGYHFSKSVVAKACGELGLDIREIHQSGQRQNGPLQRILKGDTNGVSKTGKASGIELSQEILNARARDAIKDLFPMIPDKDMQEIVAWAFRKGNNKVGTVEDLSLARRVQLAVVAHIRHVYTEYDNLLKTGSWLEARKKVEEACLYRLVRWRGDEDAGGNDDLEQIVREVVVISDDDSDIEGNSDDLEVTDRDSSVEIISSEEFALQHGPRLRDRAQSLVTTGESHETFLGSRPLLHTEFWPRRSPEVASKAPIKVDRRGFQRYRAWDQAMERYRQEISPPTLVARDPVRLREEQYHGGRSNEQLPDRPFDPSRAAESFHRLPGPSDNSAGVSLVPIHQRRHRDIGDQDHSPYMDSQESLNHYTSNGYRYKPVMAGDLARDPQYRSSPRASHDHLVHEDVLRNDGFAHEPFRAPSVARNNSWHASGYDAILPSIEKSTVRPNPVHVEYDSPKNKQGKLNNESPRLPGQGSQLASAQYRRNGYPIVHIDNNHDGHGVANKRRKTGYIPSRGKLAEPDCTMRTHGSHNSTVLPMNPQHTRELPASLRSPLDSGVSRIRLATPPREDRFSPGGYPAGLSYISSGPCATSQRSGVAYRPVSDTPETPFVSHKPLHQPPIADFPTSQSAMNVVHSSLPTSSFSKELYPSRGDHQRLQQTTQVRAYPAPLPWNTNDYERVLFPSQTASRDTQPVRQKALAQHVFGAPTSLQSTGPIVTENRFIDQTHQLHQHSERPRSRLEPGSLLGYEGRGPPQPPLPNTVTQNAFVSKTTPYNSRVHKELPRYDNYEHVGHDTKHPTQSDGDPAYIARRQPEPPIRHEAMTGRGFHPRPLPPESSQHHDDSGLKDHDVIIIDERKDTYPEQYNTSHSSYRNSPPRYVYEQRPRYGHQIVPIDYRDQPQLQYRKAPPREIIVLE